VQPHVRTGSGGAHLYVRHPGFRVKTLSGKAKEALRARYPGVDIRGEGGYAVFIGRNEDGEYVWLREPEPDMPSVIPDDLWRLIQGDEAASGWEMPMEAALPPTPDVIAGLLHRAIRLSRTGRNDAGFWLACQLRDHAVPLNDAENMMQHYQRTVGSTNTKGAEEPYTVNEAVASLAQAYNAPPRQPIPAVVIKHAGADVTGRYGTGRPQHHYAIPDQESEEKA